MVEDRLRPQAWTLRRNPEAAGGATLACADCGAKPPLLYRGRRFQERQWVDVDAARLCLKCFTARAALRPELAAS